jgi:hypothetical protein
VIHRRRAIAARPDQFDHGFDQAFFGVRVSSHGCPKVEARRLVNYFVFPDHQLQKNEMGKTSPEMVGSIP